MGRMSNVIDAMNTGRFEAKFREVYQTGGGSSAPRIILKYYGTTKPGTEAVSDNSGSAKAAEQYHYATCDNITFEEAWDALSKGEYADALMFIDGKLVLDSNITAITYEWAKAVNVGSVCVRDNEKFIGISFVPTCVDLIYLMIDVSSSPPLSATFYWSEDGEISTDVIRLLGK